MFIKLLIISVILIAIAFAGLGIRILLKTNGRFPEIHVGRNRDMRKLGIKCAHKTDTGFTSAGSSGCADCSDGTC